LVHTIARECIVIKSNFLASSAAMFLLLLGSACESEQLDAGQLVWGESTIVNGWTVSAPMSKLRTKPQRPATPNSQPALYPQFVPPSGWNPKWKIPDVWITPSGERVFRYPDRPNEEIPFERTGAQPIYGSPPSVSSFQLSYSAVNNTAIITLDGPASDYATCAAFGVTVSGNGQSTTLKSKDIQMLASSLATRGLTRLTLPNGQGDVQVGMLAFVDAQGVFYIDFAFGSLYREAVCFPIITNP
jgi:hypothetical protein